MNYRRLLLPGLLCLGVALACKSEPEPGEINEPEAPANDDDDTNAGAPGAGGNGDNTRKGDADAGPDDTRTKPDRKGERGSSCDSSNDCQESLSCIVTSNCPAGVACANKSCQRSNFEIMGTGRQCHVTDCTTTKDCCGDKPQKAPEKCADRENICRTPTVPGCLVSTICAEDTDCGDGVCPEGFCSLDSQTPCSIAAPCETNTCTDGLCSVNGTDCSISTCSINTCSTRRCNCTNPDYDPTNPICTDPECDDVCGYVCDKERCVADTSCETETDCLTKPTTPLCDDSGKCVECLTSDDCVDDDCIDGRCGPECRGDTQCGAFEACQENKCVFVGCQSDRECVLGGVAAPGQDPRLATCSIVAGIGSCVFPCEIDAQCALTEVCLNGRCEYIGCETDGECKTISGLHNQPLPSDERPWITNAECREEPTASE